MTVDYLIIGQGICGTFLSWNLVNAGRSVMVIDEPRPFSSTKVASGVINPITGRRLVKTWMIDEVLPFAIDAYEHLGWVLGVQLSRQCDTLMFHPTLQMREAFEERFGAATEYLAREDESVWLPYFHFNYGIGRISPCLHIDLNAMLDKWRSHLSGKGMLLQQRFEATELSIGESQVKYGNITAEKIIFCNGTDAFDLPFFDKLPHAANKGEVLIAEIPGLPATNIFKQGLSIVPWSDGLFWVGSTYEWNFNDVLPTERFRKKTEEQLRYWLKLPFRIVDHSASVRPATLERRPFVGFHPLHPAVGIFNGMGTKGCSLAPYFAHELTRLLINNTPLMPEADINRFTRILTQR